MNLTQISIEKLLKYGLIQTIQAKEKYESTELSDNVIAYTSICIHLDEYLKQKEVEFDVWPLWNEVEQQVRRIIMIHLKEKYGKNWRDKFLNKNPTDERTKAIENMEKRRGNDKRKFGSRASTNLVDYTYPREMWGVFITADWTWFQDILGDNRQIWKHRFQLLQKIRNPIAHSNRDFISRNEQNEAKLICETILAKIGDWEDRLKKGE